MIGHHLRFYCLRNIHHVIKVGKPSVVFRHGGPCISLFKRDSSRTIQFVDSNIPAPRPPKPERVDDIQYAEAICHNLAQTYPERYHFLGSLAEKLDSNEGEKIYHSRKYFCNGVWKVVIFLFFSKMLSSFCPKNHWGKLVTEVVYTLKILKICFRHASLMRLKINVWKCSMIYQTKGNWPSLVHFMLTTWFVIIVTTLPMFITLIFTF